MFKAMKSIAAAVSFMLLVVFVSMGISPAANANGGEIWTSQNAAVDNDWLGVTYGNGLFVAVSFSGTGNRVMTSPDGINWTSRASAANNDWHSVTYGNGLFVAVSTSGAGNRVMTSPDGITWTSRTSASDNKWLGVTYGNGLFVAVSYTGTGNRVMTAPSTIAPVYVPPMLPSVAPAITVNNGVITCTIGEYSRAATSVVFSLFVDGNHVATNFSATGDYLPSWLAPWADASTIQRTASLTSASWNIGVVGNGSRASCSTLAYSQHATGLISSDSISLP